MPEQRIGACSICGGEVIGWVGPLWSTAPPPPPRCKNCGAVSAAHDPVIPMRPDTVPARPARGRLGRRWINGMGD
jgi:hypothetical protein